MQAKTSWWRCERLATNHLLPRSSEPPLIAAARVLMRTGCRSLLSRIDRESSGVVSAQQFLDIFSAKWIEADSEELQVILAHCCCCRAGSHTRAAVLLLPVRLLHDDDNKGYITKDDLDRCALLPRFPARISINPKLPPAWCRAAGCRPC